MEADVSVATVYAHLPSLDELLPACGAHVMERVRPPSPESAAAIVGDAPTLEERFERIAHELFSFYERGGPHIEVDVRERQLAGMRERETYLLDPKADVMSVPRRESRSHGSSLGSKLRRFCNGTRFRYAFR